MNNSFYIAGIAAKLDDEENHVEQPEVRRRLVSDPCLPMRLPTTSFIQREAESAGPRAILRSLRRSPTPPMDGNTDGEEEEEEEEEESKRPLARRASTSSSLRSLDAAGSMLKGWMSPKQTKSSGTSWKEPQPFEIFRAVERKDIMFLMEVRDRAFHLLLRKSGDATPLVHAMRIGESHRDVQIVLLGALSRWVNHLEDSDMADKRTKPMLKALRTNLKLAIDYGLQRAQSDLIASFLQTLIMSEGDRWVIAQTHDVALALKAGTEGKPVSAAEQAVRKFCTRELGKAELIASLEDYIANATADLLIMGAWSCVLDVVDGEAIMTYYFARDDRVFKAFQDRVHEKRVDINRHASKRLRWQLRVLQQVLDGRTTTYRSKVELLAGELDNGQGV